MGAVDPSGKNIDIAYGWTPRDALRAVLQQHYAFNSEDAEFVGEEPDFMDIDAGRIHTHDWEQYQEEERFSNRGNEPTVRITRPYTLTTEEDRVRIVIRNVWVEVNYMEDKRAEVSFSFAIDLEESKWEGEDHARSELEKTWKCERISTEPK